MLLDTHGIDVGNRQYLLRMHEDRGEYELVQCGDLRAEALIALKSEQDRLASQPPPAAPQAATAAANAANSQPPAQSSSEQRRRPPGAAPKGKVWQDGRWVHARDARRDHAPTANLTLKPRPCGQIPKGKMWDGQVGCWVDRKRGFSKVTAPEASAADENLPPRPRNTRRRTGHT